VVEGAKCGTVFLQEGEQAIATTHLIIAIEESRVEGKTVDSIGA
jgi:hypothetical protein